MFKNAGFTLLEIIIILTIFVALSLIGVGSIFEFQKKTLLESTANEFASTLREARTKSISGELLAGERAEDFTSDGLPKYGIRVDDLNYFLFREFQSLGSPVYQREDLKVFSIDSKLTLTPSPGEIIFEHKGPGGPMTFILQRKDGKGTVEIAVSERGVTLKKI